MAMILNIDTATDHASVCISNDGNLLAIRESNSQKEHASFLHVAIKSLLEEVGLAPSALDAVAITAGPGSYTGLRVSMAAAKGLCYALKKPLIAVNTLEVMARAARDLLLNQPGSPALLCPMIDARRMEVFTALYDFDLNVFLKPCSLVLEKDTFDVWLSKPIYFFGNVSGKAKLFESANSNIIDIQLSAIDLGKISFDLFNKRTFSNMAYLEPEYLKEFYTVKQV